MSSRQLQGRYIAASSRIGGKLISQNIKRHTPIFQRGTGASEKQALRDAANALSALWKIAESSKR